MEYSQKHQHLLKTLPKSRKRVPSQEQVKQRADSEFLSSLSLGKKLNGASTATSPKSSAKHADEPEIVTVDLIFWSDGFTVAQGPLQSYTEPEGLRLLERIKNG